ncbi:MAG: Fic/DOC family N-terminal domain-containing protein [bacterium]|nr:Fic/DOC family N-terminal domain-containing protein [bacterium]
MKPYIPEQLPLKNLDWIRFITLIGNTNAELARYDGILQGIVNPHILLSPLTTKEAVLSSRIEGTQATLEEVLEFEASQKIDIITEREKDIQEIINYRKSIRFAVDWLSVKPITLNMIKQVHSILLDSVRGKDKGRGRFRAVQNWIGRPGTPVEQADYVPPEPMQLMEALSDFEKYIHYDEKDRLVQLAIIHAQFEIIHPFLDGNGRLGRILIPLFLYEKKLLHSPMFYISEHLEKYRDEYYERLKAITREKKWDEWIEFFLKAVVEQAKLNSQKTIAILNLYNKEKERIQSVTRSQYVMKILDTLFARPIFSTTDFIRESGIPKRSAIRILNLIEKERIITVLRPSSGRKANILMFNKLIEIIQ